MLSLWIECFKMGLRELWRHKLRSFLTMIGMIMGVSVVIVCVSVVQGVKESLIGDIRRAGRNMIIVSSRETKKAAGAAAPAAGTAAGIALPTADGEAAEQQRQAVSQPLASTNLTRSDAEAIGLECDAISEATGVDGMKLQAISDTNDSFVTVTGANQNYTSIRNWGIDEGRLLDPFDIVAQRRVCLIGQTAARELFGDESPLGGSVRIGQHSFKIVGILEAKGVNPLGEDEDNAIILPLPVLLRDLKGITEPGAIVCSAVSDAEVERAVQQITDLLRQRHRLQEDDEADFEVKTLKEKEEQARQVSDQMTLLMFFLALVSLVVGGVGIMNIMLVAVTERTREIGIRMAIGASSKMINRQFLVEAGVVSSAGGSVGILLGVIGALAISDAIGVEAMLTPGIVLLAFLFSAGVGVAFGLLPARRAAALNPIEALRHD